MVTQEILRVVLPKHVKAEMRVEGVISSTNSLIAGHLTIRLNAVLEAEELPASIADLDTSLTWVAWLNLGFGF